MLKRFRLTLRLQIGLASVGLLTILVLVYGFVAAVGPGTSIRNIAQSEGIVHVTLAVEPAVSSPGDPLTLRITAVNRGASRASIMVDSVVPDGVSYDARRLPAGTTFNFQSDSFSWQPTIPARETRVFELPLTAGVANLSDPVRHVRAQYQNGRVSDSLSADFWIGLLPSVGILGAETVSIGQPVQLYADIDGAGPFIQKWDLGDGRIFRANDPVVTFPRAGDYTVELEVENPLGRVSAERRLTVVPDPVALFSLSDPTPGTGQTIIFLNQSGGAGPLTTEWDFGDGTKSAELQPTHQFAEPGTYRIQLTVENEFGLSETTVLVEVGNSPSVEMLLPGRTTAGEPVSAIAIGDESITDYIWNLGDGREQAGQDVRLNWNKAGTYLVTMSASNQFGTTRLAQEITVEAGILRSFLPVILRTFNAVEYRESLDAAAALEPDFSTFVPIDLSETIVPEDSSQEQRLLWYINKARENNDLPPLEYVETLSIASKRHTNDMAFNRFWGHTGSDGSRPAERQTAAGYEGGYAGEATAWGFEFPSGAVGFWLQSPSHRPLILNPRADQVGVAFTYDDTAPSIYYWTAEFGSSTLDYAVPWAEAAPAPAPTAAPTQAPIIVATLAPPATPTPEQSVENTPEPTEEARPVESPTPTPTEVPTETPEPTSPALQPGGSAETPTPSPTATPTSVPTETPTPEPTATAEPTATSVPTETPTPTPTNTPTATPVPTLPVLPTQIPATATPEPSESDDAGRTEESTTEVSADDDTISAETITRRFLNALLDDPSGVQALPYATYAMQGELLDGGAIGALQLDTSFDSYEIGSVQSEGTNAIVSVRANGNESRTLSLLFVENQWRVDTVSQ